MIFPLFMALTLPKRPYYIDDNGMIHEGNPLEPHSVAHKHGHSGLLATLVLLTPGKTLLVYPIAKYLGIWDKMKEYYNKQRGKLHVK